MCSAPPGPTTLSAPAAWHGSTASLSQAVASIQWARSSPSWREEGSNFGNKHCLANMASKEAGKFGILQTTPTVQGCIVTTESKMSLQASKPQVFQPASPPSSAELSCSYLHPTAAAALVVLPARNEKCAHGTSISPAGVESPSSHHTVLPDQWMMGNSKRGRQARCKPRASGTSTGAQTGSSQFCFGMVLFLRVFFTRAVLMHKGTIFAVICSISALNSACRVLYAELKLQTLNKTSIPQPHPLLGPPWSSTPGFHPHPPPNSAASPRIGVPLPKFLQCLWRLATQSTLRNEEYGPKKAAAPLPSQAESPVEEGDPHTPNLLPKHLPPPGARAQGQQDTLCREVTHIQVTCGSLTATLLI